MYPTTTFRWIDNSAIQTTTEPDYYENAPLYLLASSFDMGTEELQEIYGEDFFKMYGTKMNFVKNGQPALQAANCISSGARLLVKRIVAPDSTLANIVLVSTVTKTRTAIIAEDPTDPNVVTYDQAIDILTGKEEPITPVVRENSVEKAIAQSFSVSRSTNNGELYPVTMDTVIDTESVPILPGEESGLNGITVTSDVGSYDRYTVITVEPEKSINNVYLYKLVSSKDEINFPALSDECILESDDGGEYNIWNGEEIKVPDGYKYIVIVEAVRDNGYHAVAAGSVFITAKDETMYIIKEANITVKWEAVSITDCKKPEEVANKAVECESSEDWLETDSETGAITYNSSISLPFIVITDNGRGKSYKSIRFTPDYIASRTNTNMFYTVQIYNKGTRLDKSLNTINPYCIVDNKSYSINNDTTKQLNIYYDDSVYDEYFNFIREALELDESILRKYDIIYGTTNTGDYIPGFNIDPESIDLDSDFGIELQNGSDGSFEDVAFGTDAYTEELVSFFKGEFDDSIWDVDQYKISAVFDANYPEPVKDAILEFVNFREDCVYFRDLGINVFSYYDIYEKEKTYKSEFKVSRFVADYFTTYQIYDPETKKRTRVSMMYDFAECMIAHFRNAFAKPIAGIVNDMVLKNAIKGTINFTPRKTPKVNQKQLLDDLKVNYAMFGNNDRCIVHTLYSSQLEYTQLSYVNNVLAIQQVMRIVRDACPANRYRFVTGNDFSEYESAVTNILNQVSDEFEQLTFGYEQDDMIAAQKIFYGNIYFRFKNWAQTEQFDLYALPVTVEG